MLVITQGAVQAFASELDICAKFPESWQCLIFRFSQIKEKPENMVSELLDKITSLFGDNGGRAFVFGNGDVHVLIRCVTHKGFKNLVEQLSVFMFPASVEDMSSIHEVRQDFKTLKNCLVSREEKIQERAEDTQRPIDFNKEFYIEMTRTLQARRLKRGMPGILIAEDDPFSLKLVCKTLGQNYALYTAHDGRSALESYLLNAPDMLFLDIGLPDVSGLDLIEKICKADPMAYIVMLSGNGYKDNVVRAIECGARGFVSKPFSQDKLFYYIAKCPIIQQKQIRV